MRILLALLLSFGSGVGMAQELLPDPLPLPPVTPLPPGVEPRPPVTPLPPGVEPRPPVTPLPPGLEPRPPVTPGGQKVLGAWHGRGRTHHDSASPIVIGDRPSLVAFWRRAKFNGEMPEIDFDKELFVAAVFLGSRVDQSGRAWLQDGQCFQFRFGGTMDISSEPHFFAYRLPRAELRVISDGRRRVPVAPSLTGTITGPDGGPVPKGAVALVRLLDLSEPGQTKTTAEQRLAILDGFPFRYTLRFDTAGLELTKDRNYILSVMIHTDDMSFIYGTPIDTDRKAKSGYPDDTRISLMENGKFRTKIDIPVSRNPGVKKVGP